MNINPDELLDPRECDWCNKQYEYGDGGRIGSDNICGDCVEYDRSIE